ncbi:MAG: dienelactone hydrolase family protein [Chloroflexi bacterium]|nr:dienelactone hydrolase family protein [Chloroflexota bacterium]
MDGSNSSEDRLQIEVGDRTVSAIKTSPGGPSRFTFVYAPGAGSNIEDPFGQFLSLRLACEGITTVRFQFPYMEAGKRPPDRPPLLQETWRAAIRVARSDNGKLIVGGRSMGGRVASQVVSQGTQVDGLALFAYPLHAPAKPTVWRDEHLPDIGVPTFFCSGDRDNFASPNELNTVTSKIPNPTVHILSGADHGFAVLKASGRSRQDVWDDALEAILGWLEAASFG